ncbi:MAG: hypothetical protein ACFFCS_15380 [Candidatus Hodarchaeota archaeon]
MNEPGFNFYKTSMKKRENIPTRVEKGVVWEQLVAAGYFPRERKNNGPRSDKSLVNIPLS